jgi:glycosyltransferase involved in cell wall biosynthesis
LKILHIYKNAYPNSYGGVESVIHQLCLELSSRSIDSVVLTTGNKNYEYIINKNYKVITCKSQMTILSMPISFSFIINYIKLIKNKDLVHYHYPWPFMDLIEIFLNKNVKSVVTYHSDIIKQKKAKLIYNYINHIFFKRVSLIIPTSENYYITSDTLKKVDSRKIKIITIGLDEKNYKINKNIKYYELKKQFNYKFFLFVGVLRYYKGLHILINAMKNKYYKVIIIGSGPIENELKIRCEKLKLDNVIFMGKVSNEIKHIILDLSYCLVFPSNLRSEAFGVSLLEGAIFNKPLISSEIGTGTSFVNINNHTGLVIPPSDPEALAIAMQYLYNNSDISKEMGNNAYQRYKNLFTSELMVNKYIDVYKKLI